MSDALTWKRLASRPGPELPLFKVRFDTMRHPVSADTFERVVLETSDWVTVVAVTADRKIVMVEQYRFGVGELTTEPVSGIVDSGEDSEAAGRRELLEEAGYGEGDWRYLGAVQGNPAYHDNLCHLWFADNVIPVQQAEPDPGEAIRVHLMTLDEIKAGIESGSIIHPHGLAGLCRVFPLWEFPCTDL